MAKKKKFPTFATILLAIGIIWLMSELGYISFRFVPWWPLILIIVAMGMIINNYTND